jgi:acetyl-CoA acetyltransferase
MSGGFRDCFAIAGVGLTPTARVGAPGMSGLMLEAWAARLAIEDAGLRREDIDGAVHTMMATPHPPAQWTDTYSRTLGLKPNFYLNVSRGGQAAHNGLILATQALALGLANYVIVSCGLPGRSASRAAPSEANANNPTSDVGVSMAEFITHGLGVVGFDAGATAATVHGFFASRHMHEYGTTAEQLGAVALAMREWACRNPEARFHGVPATIEDYLRSPYIIEPLRRMDCCVQSDLGAALVVTTAERAADLRCPPVYLKGVGIGDQARDQWWEKSNYTQVDAGFAARTAFNTAGVTLDDIDVAEFYDCFTTEVVFYVEDYGLCAKGEGGEYVASGALAPGGAFPLNTYGGLLSGMYLFDYPGVVEAVRQLRGEAGERQIEGAELALTNGHGGEMIMPGMCSSHATMVLGSVTG